MATTVVDTQGVVSTVRVHRGRIALISLGLVVLGLAMVALPTRPDAKTTGQPSPVARFAQCVQAHEPQCSLPDALVKDSVEMSPREAADAIEPGQDSWAVLHRVQDGPQLAYLVLPTHPDKIYHLSSSSFKSAHAMDDFLVKHGVHVGRDQGVVEEEYRLTPMGFIGAMAGTVAERAGVKLIGRVLGGVVQELL